ncbi:centrosomal protein of 162 kDa isoform X2 [Toxorhynchites rutilus septentrionalis]|uniref:centrosomal protein of 162 kDa isoform X2 n=1 Tax=Toxorhynchites rutilus septentrionalis TaxID=329112 RepID=UPI002479E3E7|nr:centrosomal protein of 162 kDa isoform X2 [Toxorhynchites rutilus septentrionalis]
MSFQPPAELKMGGESAMEKLLEAQQQQLDDITSESSFLEFLRNEQSCLAAVVISGGCGGNASARDEGGANGGSPSEVEVASIFEQVSRLAGSPGGDNRSVEEILREAEQLIQNQPLFSEVGKFKTNGTGLGEVTKAIVGMRDISSESTPSEMKSGMLEELEAIEAKREEENNQQLNKVKLQHAESSPQRHTIRRKSFVISTGEKDEEHDRRPHSDQTYTLPTPVVAAVTPVEMRTKKIGGSPGGGKSLTPKKRNTNAKQQCPPAAVADCVQQQQQHENKENHQLLSQSQIRDLEAIYALTLNETLVERKIASPERTFCDKSTAPSPTHSALNASDSPSWAKERELEGSINRLQEKLKDTEERYESLKIQYETLSQVHRTLRENHSTIQEDSDKLKLDVQHLTECANVLRSELQSARFDRDAALELQKLLQSELEESRREKKRYQELNEKDTKTIQDLQRQCREMERILMRKHPDSVSALIVASRNTGNSKPAEDASQTRRLLEQRIAQLEADAKEQDAKAQGILANVQARFHSVQSKYETHIADLEMQVLSLQEINCKLNEKIIRQMDELSSITSHAASSLARVSAQTSSSAAQTDDLLPLQKECIKTRSISVQTDSKLTGCGGVVGRAQQPGGQKRAASACGKIPNSLSDSQIQSREDAHLLATIRGMRVDLAIKEKAVQRLTREVEDCKKTIKKLQKERETHSKAEGKTGTSVVKVKSYDPAQFADSAASDTNALKDAHLKIKLLEADYKTLHDKRLQDLKTLQAAHERELAACHETVRILQQRLGDREELLHTKEKRRPNHNIDYYALKAKWKRNFKKQLIAPSSSLGRPQSSLVARNLAGTTPHRAGAAVAHAGGGPQQGR